MKARCESLAEHYARLRARWSVRAQQPRCTVGDKPCALARWVEEPATLNERYGVGAVAMRARRTG